MRHGEAAFIQFALGDISSPAVREREAPFWLKTAIGLTLRLTAQFHARVSRIAVFGRERAARFRGLGA